MVRRVIKIVALISVVIRATATAAAECSCESAEGAAETVLETESGEGKQLKLRFETKPITKQNKLAFLCAEPAKPVTVAKLWMPDHRHGSSPTKLVEVEESCTRVEKVNFVMDGIWEIRVKLADEDTATFKFNVGLPKS